MSALQNQIRGAFPRELDAISRRARSRCHDPRALALAPRGFEKWERLARAEEAQRIAEIVRRDARWIGDPQVDQWVERIYCMSFGLEAAGAAAAMPLGPLDVLGGSSTVVGYVQGELGITTATGVSAWASQIGGSTLDFSQAGTTQQPVYTANDSTLWGRSTVAGDGSNDVLNSAWNPPAPGTTPSWIRCVANRVTDVAAGTLFAGTSTTTLRFARSNATLVLITNGTSSSTRTMTIATWYRTEAMFANSATVDYLKVGSSNTGVGTATGNGDPATWRLFSTSTAGANPGNYSLSKLLVLNAEPTALQKALFDGIDTAFYNGNITM